ncbi:MAG: hypothetical protein Q4P26_04405 [Lachnospiraceae bacterium]|mgnify:FL=1|nr:hypothetical protein [Lachnospiraceae bacterium]
MERAGEEKTFCKRETEENSMEQKGVQKIKSAGTNRHQADTEKNSEEAARKKELLRERVERIYLSLHLRP